MHKIRSQYPILENYTYLNTANHGLISQKLIDYRCDELVKMRDRASLYTNQRSIFMDEVRLTVAQFLHASVENTAVIPNFSIGFNRLIDGIDKNAKILLLEGDYPSINNPVEQRGFNCVYATIDQYLEDHILKACQQHRPDFFCFSVVQYISGIKIDLDFLKQLKQQFPNMILIGDLTQYVGCEEFRFRESGLDIILASCYKWLNAGDGNGFICVKEEVKERILPKHIILPNQQQTTYTIPEFIARFEPGHQDMMAFGSLKIAMQEVQQIGMDTIQKELQHWTQIAKSEFIKRDLLSESVVYRKDHSTIFNIKGNEALFNKLTENKILTSLRGDGIRVSFSYFNNQEDLRKLLSLF